MLKLWFVYIYSTVYLSGLILTCGKLPAHLGLIIIISHPIRIGEGMQKRAEAKKPPGGAQQIYILNIKIIEFPKPSPSKKKIYNIREAARKPFGDL